MSGDLYATSQTESCISLQSLKLKYENTSTRKAAGNKSDVNGQSPFPWTKKRKGKGLKNMGSRRLKEKRKEVDTETCGVQGNSEG